MPGWPSDVNARVTIGSLREVAAVFLRVPHRHVADAVRRQRREDEEEVGDGEDIHQQ